ncbi:MAG: hypothetical protein AMQ74_01862 [Candidatus Methanofastidiosum methylothiophilum]|uniref:Uncharacterized protein n=1 Tax=Candidatus Methanofastidiosum methylothiophilum TaxID=1705564 RepID=A0A150IMD3_9EURY|nr:MAG: hypothetical protein AMQ74_01862 [Candidatus Methanofastidiosum methylthiophilus]
MDKTTHEIIKTYIKESEGNSFVNLKTPDLWIEAKPALWIYE